MASQTCVTSQHATLSGTTADDITFTGRGRSLRVTNRSTDQDLYFNYNTSTVPVALADDTIYVGPSTSVILSPGGLITSVRLVGNGNGYSVSIA